MDSTCLLILHDIRSAHNVGAMLRSADAFGVKKVYIGGYSPYPQVKNDTRLPHVIEKTTKDIRKTALGAEQSVTIEHYDSVEELIKKLSDQGVWIVGLEQDSQSTDIKTLPADREVAVLVGREVDGIDPHLLSLCDQICEIPMYGSKESLNVAVACGIALYALCSLRSL